MKLSKTARIITGLLTAGVVLYPFLILLFVLGMTLLMPLSVILLEQNSSPGGSALTGMVFFLVFILYIFLQFFLVFLLIGMSIFYLVHVIKNKTGRDIWRVILGVGVFYLPYLAMPVYYFIYIWPEHPPQWALEPAQSAS
jgi:hypothetical protein